MSLTAIIAGTYVQFDTYCRRHGYNPHRAIYAGADATRLQGLEPSRTIIVLTGTYWDSPVYQSDPYRIMEHHGATIRHDPI